MGDTVIGEVDDVVGSVRDPIVLFSVLYYIYFPVMFIILLFSHSSDTARR